MRSKEVVLCEFWQRNLCSFRAVFIPILIASNWWIFTAVYGSSHWSFWHNPLAVRHRRARSLPNIRWRFWPIARVLTPLDTKNIISIALLGDSAALPSFILSLSASSLFSTLIHSEILSTLISLLKASCHYDDNAFMCPSVIISLIGVHSNKTLHSTYS